MALERIDLDVLERGCNEVESWPKNTATTNYVGTGGRTYEEYKPGVVLSIRQARAMIAELRASRQAIKEIIAEREAGKRLCEECMTTLPNHEEWCSVAIIGSYLSRE